MIDELYVPIAIALGCLLLLWRFSPRPEAKRQAAESQLREHVRKQADQDYSLRRALTDLQDFVRLGAPVIGQPHLSCAPVAELPAAPERRLDFVKELIRQAVARYGMSMPLVKVRFHKHSGNHAGAIRIDADGCWAVDISPVYKEDLEALATIIAHEVGHIALHRSCVRLDPIERNEELTDATAVLAGYGPVFLRTVVRDTVAHHADRVEINWDRLGYLRPAALSFLSALRVELAGGHAEFYRDHVEEWQRPAVEDYIALRDEWVRRLSSRGGDDVRCFACRTRFRLPNIRALVRVKCPVCSYSYEAHLVAT